MSPRRAQMSVHKRTDTRLGFTAPRWAHVQGRHTEVDAQWRPSGKSVDINTEVFTETLLKCLWAVKAQPRMKLGLEFRKHHKNRMANKSRRQLNK